MFLLKFRIESKCANIIVNPKSAALVSHGVRVALINVDVGCVRPKMSSIFLSLNNMYGRRCGTVVFGA